MSGPHQAQREKAYNQGCMWGMAGGNADHCPYQDADLAQWWQQGWQDGHCAWRERQSPETQGQP
ncbi:MAG: ribosome modulation factor [Alcanivorax sp.]|nr:ribosome modulation factor [Alcanivorax sp.]